MSNIFKTSFYNKPVAEQYIHEDLCDNVSEMLVRANPKLSTNVKLMTDGNFVMLESFDACKEISISKFKNFKTYSKTIYNNDVCKFWKKLDKTFAYSILQEHDDISIKTSYDKQYETFYWSGCEYIDSLQYDQAYGILAPIWLDDKIPDRFVIFKVKEPSYHKYKDNSENTEETDNSTKELDFKKDILNKCEIVKTFDLTESTNLGRYIRRYYNQPGFPESPLTVFDDGISFNGISISTGEFTSIKEHCSERMWRHDETVLEFDEYITSGFERNGIIVANILNIEFLFDDETAEEYEYSRYFGLYCDLAVDDEITISKDGLYGLDNDYKFRISDFDIYHTQKFITNNNDGVSIPYVVDNFTNNQTHPIAKNFNVVSTLNSVFCIEDIDKNLHSINRTTENLNDTIRLVDKSIDLGKLKGFVECIDSVTCYYEDNDTPSSLRFRILDEIPGRTLIKLCQNGIPVHEDIISNDVINNLQAVNQYDADPSDPNDYSIEYADSDYAMFCCDGTPNQIAEAIANAFNKTYDVGIKAYYCRDTVHLISTNSSIAYNNYSIEIDFQNPSTDIDNYFEFPNGFSLYGSNKAAHLKCSEDVVDKFIVGNYIPSRSHNGYNKIVSIVVDYDNTRKTDAKLEFTDGIYYDILLDSDGVYASKTNTTKVFESFTPTLCRLQFYPVKDLEMSTYHSTTKYGDLGELNYEAEYVSKNLKTQNGEIYINENASLDNYNQLTFEINGQEITINIESLNDLLIDTAYTASDISIQGPDSNGEYTISFALLLDNENYIPGETFSLNDEFSFDTLSTELNVPALTYLTSEYDRCYENLNPNLMLLSKTQPWICAWVLKNGKDIREKPYRLNCNPVFGQYSFTPDTTDYEPEPTHYNQEWMYIMESPKVLNELLDNGELDQRKIWSYIGETMESNEDSMEIFENRLKDTNINWFDVYFKRDNLTLYKNNNDAYWSTPDYTKRYSLLHNGSDNTNAETFFRGVKIEFILKSDWDEALDNNLDTIKTTYSDELNDYKFSAVYVPICKSDGTSVNDTKIKVIRNDVFKHIVLVQYIIVKYYDAFTTYLNKTCNLSDDAEYIDLGNITRYKLYTPTNDDFVQSDEICIRGNGKIYEISYNGDNCRIFGENTTFITDFDNNKTTKRMLVIKNPGYSNIHFYEVIRIDKIESDTLMYGEVLNSGDISDIQSKYNINGHISYVSGNYVQKSSTYFILDCNAEQFAHNINRSVVASIKHAININQKAEVVYEHVDKNGNIHSSDGVTTDDVTLYEHTFALKIIEPQENAKYEYMSLLFDGEYIRYGTLPQFAAPMYRHTGKFTPLRNDVLYYTDPFIDEFSKDPDLINPLKVEIFNKSRYLNTCFDLYDNVKTDFGLLYDVAFHRTNENNTNIFKLTGNEKPLYPTSNRFSIGHRNIQTFNSNWDPWIFTRTLSSTLETDCHGTLSMKENKSFFGSKTLHVPDSFMFETFTYTFDLEAHDTDIEILEKESHIEMLLYIEQQLINKLRDDIHDLFYEYIVSEYSYGDKTTIDDDIETYIKTNLTKLYQLSDIKLYTYEKSTSTAPYFIYDGLNMDNIHKKMHGLNENRVMGISSVTGSNFDKKLVINKKSGTQYNIGLCVLITKK